MADLKFITPTFAVTSALTEADFADLAARGVAAVISNRPDGEDGATLSARAEAVSAWRAGLKFRHLPVAKHEVFEEDAVHAMAEAIKSLDGVIVAHCKSGWRSAILWAAASARTSPADCVAAAAKRAGFDLSEVREEIAAQAGKSRILSREAASALDCSESVAAAA
ncbi:MAG TPA: TIGR01244 family sulfur transferase [Hyphomicrobiaceae bacterium]|nr:TIGR01244 family sulfur transferase [Hyphomicrobiaceae bacterium]